MKSRGILARACAVVLATQAFGLARAQGGAESAATGDFRPVLIVGGDREYPPYEFIDKDGNPAGYNVDLTRAIAEVMGFRVEFQLGAWGEAGKALRQGRIQVLQGAPYSEERTRELDFSPPHTVLHFSVFARSGTPAPWPSGIAGLEGKVVVTRRGSVTFERLSADPRRWTVIGTPTFADALRLLASGEGDYAIAAALPAASVIRELGLSNLEAVQTGFGSLDYCYAVRKGDTELLTRITQGLAILKKTGRYEAIHQRWLGVVESKPVTFRSAAKYLAALLTPLLLILGAIGLWTRSLSAKVAERTRSLALVVDELKRNQQQLVQADKMAALGVLVSGVAHEINNPNGLIALNVPTLKVAYLDALEILDAHHREHGEFDLGNTPYSQMRDEIPRMFDAVSDGSRRIKRIVEDLKDFARKTDAPRHEPTDLNDVARAAVRLVEPSIRKATRHFTAQLEELPQVSGDRQRLEQVVVNLLLNSCQAMQDPERSIAIWTEHDPQQHRVVLHVRDEGEGIPPEHLTRLTDPFFTTRREHGGTGLGLSVSAAIVKEHGGTLDFVSEPGRGTIAMLGLPVARTT